LLAHRIDIDFLERRGRSGAAAATEALTGANGEEVRSKA
jgi:hypothetical protein